MPVHVLAGNHDDRDVGCFEKFEHGDFFAPAVLAFIDDDFGKTLSE